VPPPPPSSSSVSSDTSRKIFVFADEFPEFPGGETGLIKFLQQNTLYPQMERDNDIQGKVMIRFVVCETGKVSDIQVLRGVSPNLDMESVRVIRMLPRFKPGKVKGEPVRVYYNLPFVFKLQ
jgi:protein TonB